MLRSKVMSLTPVVAKQPHLFSHFVHELMVFDQSLRDEWNYDAGNIVHGWKGLTWEILGKRKWFDTWLRVEKDCEFNSLPTKRKLRCSVVALARYKDIINAPEAHDIDYDSVETTFTKPTHAAIRVNDLLETITDRYRPLASFSQKLRFLIEIQIEIFDMYYNRLLDSLSRFHTSSSALGRTLQGDGKDFAAEVTGLKGIERLCRIYGSAEYLEKKMRDWSEEVFFLELYDELQDRVQTRPHTNFAGPMSVEAVAQRTSNTIHPANDEDQGALFDETAASYKRLRVSTEGLLVDTLTSSVLDGFAAYTKINPWSTLSSSEQQQFAGLTAELDNPLQSINTLFALLSRTLALPSLRRIGRQFNLAVQGLLYNNVLLRNAFSPAGIAQFSKDVQAICNTLDRYLGPGQAVVGMQRLREALILLNLSQDKAGHRDDATSAGSELDAEASAGKAEMEAIGLNMWEVEKRVFRSNESAREVLEELGLEALSEVDARKVMERVLEVGEE